MKTTTDLINALRDVADECEDIGRIKLCNEAADRLEELDERVAIMSESKTGRWEKAVKYIGFLTCSNCQNCYIAPEWLEDGKWNYCPSCGAKMEPTERRGV